MKDKRREEKREERREKREDERQEKSREKTRREKKKDKRRGTAGMNFRNPIPNWAPRELISEIQFQTAPVGINLDVVSWYRSEKI